VKKQIGLKILIIFLNLYSRIDWYQSKICWLCFRNLLFFIFL